MWPNLFEQIIQQNSNESLNSEDRQKIHQSSFSSSSYGLQNSDCTDLDFIYDDTDSHSNEIAELYSYSEQHEFQHNVRAFDNILSSFNMIPSWQRLNKLEQKSIILKLLDQLDIAIKEERMKAARCLLYMAQGCWAEVQSDHEQYMWTRHNVKLLLELGGFNTFIELLNIEINNIELLAVTVRKINITLNDSIDLRCILNVIYIMIEVARNEAESDDFRKLTKDLILELNQPVAGGELFPVKLLQMITKFCSGHAPHFPMKKILLCLWKSCLLSLGGIEDLRKMKKELREKAGLDSQQEDTIEVAKLLRASSPPATAADILDTQQLIPQTISNINVSSSSHLGTIGSVQTIGGNSGAVCVGIKRTRPLRRVRTNEQFIPEQNLIKQSSLDEEQDISNEIDRQSDDEYSFPPVTESDDATGQTAAFLRNTQLIYDTTTSTQQMIYSNFPPPLLRLPWRPKVREKDIHQFLEISRSKFIGYTFNDDYKTLAGLPQPIHDGVSTLKKHRYISLSEKQIQHEDEISRTLMSAEVEISDTPTEILYRGILPNLPQYMIALLKILLAAAPTSKAKAESINIMADILPEEMPVTVTQSTRLGIDVNRHKEIIVKSVSAIILLLMKHLKLNHIYQFEFMSQHLVFANCIPLVLKFFNQHILNYVASKNVIPILDFPSCVIGDQVTTDFHTAENLCIGVTDAGSMTAQYSWRNIFSCINLLRILNKLTKWKHSRIMMLVVFKSAPILKRTLKVRHPLMQLYVLKLLKMQTKYLGRQWRKTNMKTISAIYSKVRHRLNDDWAFGNDLDARPWDFQAEECILRTCVDRFNSRRYFQQIINNVCNEQSSQTVINDVLPNESDQVTNLQLYTENQQYHMDKPIQLSFPLDIVMYEDQFSLTVAFERNYLNWLNEEVYNKNIDWDILVNSTNNYF